MLNYNIGFLEEFFMVFNNFYSGSITSEPFMLHENKIVSKYLIEGKSLNEIKQIIFDSNEFGYKTKKSILRRVSTIVKRLEGFDNLLLNKVNSDLSGDGKLIVLYSMFLSERLFREFILEFYQRKILERDFFIYRKEILNFLEKKSSSEEKIGSFSESTIRKISSVFFTMLLESGLIIKEDKKFKINLAFSLSFELKEYLLKLNDGKSFLIGIGGEDK